MRYATLLETCCEILDIESDGPSNDVHPYVFQKYEFYKTDPNDNIIYRIRKQDKFLFFLNGKWRVRIFRKILKSKYIRFKVQIRKFTEISISGFQGE